MCALWSRHWESKEAQKDSGTGETRHLYRRRVPGRLENKAPGWKVVWGAASPFLRNTTQPSHFCCTSLLPSSKVWPFLKTKTYFSKATSRPSNVILCLLILWGPGQPCTPPSPRHHHWNLCWLPPTISSHSFCSSKTLSNGWVKYRALKLDRLRF